MHDTARRSLAALFVTCAATSLLAQGPATTRPTPAVELPEARRVPAERQAAAYSDPGWQGPHTSWGHPAIEGTWSTDDMRGIPLNRPAQFGEEEFLSDDQFLERAMRDQAGRDRAVHEEDFLRNEWGVRTFGYTSLVVDPADGRTPGLNDSGLARARAAAGRGTFGTGPWNRFDDFSLYDRCISRGIASGLGAVIYGNGIRITQSPDAVSITYEMIHETRVIPLDARPPLDDAIRFYTGSGRGYWEGDTLVIESGNYTDRTSVGGAQHSEHMRVTERIRRVDREMIEYRATIDDPDTYTAPFTIRAMWTRQPDYYMYEYSCHEGNSAIGNSLSGERAYERQVAEAIAAGQPVPPRGSSMAVYGQPAADAEIFDINRGQ